MLTSLCYQSRNLTQLNEAINSDLSKLETWLQGNELLLNVAKTHSMLISTKQKHKSLKSRNEALELKIRDGELEVVQKTKYLGVQIDCCLDWKEQIKAVSTKVSRAIGILRHARSFLHVASLKLFTQVLLSPTFDTFVLSGVVLDLQTSNQLQKLKNFFFIVCIA